MLRNKLFKKHVCGFGVSPICRGQSANKNAMYYCESYNWLSSTYVVFPLALLDPWWWSTTMEGVDTDF